MKNLPTALAESVLIRVGLTVATSANDAAFQNKIYKSSMITPIISNKEMNDILKIVHSLVETSLLIKGVNETTENEKKKDDFFAILLGTLAANLLVNILGDKDVIRAGEGIIKAGQDF